MPNECQSPNAKTIVVLFKYLIFGLDLQFDIWNLLFSLCRRFVNGRRYQALKFLVVAGRNARAVQVKRGR